MKMDVLISFVIPAHNEEKTLGRCIQLIISQIKSSKKCEIIVVNDGSTDNTAGVIKKYSRYIKSLNFEKGHSAAFSRNRGAEMARGKYLVFLDADQIIEENFVSRLFSLLSERDFDVLSFFVLPYKPRTIFQKAWAGFRNAHYCRGFIFNRKIFNNLKFDERLFYIEDNEIWERFSGEGYKLHDTGLKIYHIDTETWDDFLRQRKWHGRGILGWIRVKGKYSPLRYFAPCFLIIFLFPPLGFLKYLFFAYLFLFWLYYTIKSRLPWESFLWVTIDYLGRFISLYYFIKESFKKTK